jgi:hypothetical protein
MTAGCSTGNQSSAAAPPFISAASAYLSTRASTLISPKPQVSTVRSENLAPALQAEQASDLAILNARRVADDAAGVDYTKVQVTLSDSKLSAGPGGVQILHVMDDTKLYFKAQPGTPAYTESLVGRTFKFTRGKSGPQITSMKLDDPRAPLPTTDVSH